MHTEARISSKGGRLKIPNSEGRRIKKKNASIRNASANRNQVTSIGDKLPRETLRMIGKNPHRKAVNDAKRIPFPESEIPDIVNLLDGKNTLILWIQNCLKMY